jgi:hypothetical protein
MRLLAPSALVARVVKPLRERNLLGRSDAAPAFGLSLDKLAEGLRGRIPAVGELCASEDWRKKLDHDPKEAARQFAAAAGAELDRLADEGFLEVMRGWGVTRAVLDAIDDPAPEVKAIGLRALAEIGAATPRDVHERLVALLDHKDPQVRVDAMQAVIAAEISGGRAIDRLVELIDDESRLSFEDEGRSGPREKRKVGVGDRAVRALIEVGRRHPDQLADRLIPSIRNRAPLKGKNRPAGSDSRRELPPDVQDREERRQALASGLADMVADRRVAERVFQSFWESAAHDEWESIRASAIRAQSGRLRLRAANDASRRTIPAFLLDELGGEQSAGDALYRAAVVAALADALKSAGDVASAALDRLRALCEDERRAWLRVAAWQVLIRYHEAPGMPPPWPPDPVPADE